MKVTAPAVLSACASCGRSNRIPLGHLGETGRCGACRATLDPVREPLDVDEAAFEAIVGSSPLPILVDFWAGWCGPCRAAAPHVQRVAQELAGRALVLKVDTDAQPDLAARFGVQGIPYFVVLSRGRIVRSQAGLVDARTLASWLT